VVNVTATGAACGDPPVIEWIAAMTHREWISEGIIPGSFGTLFAQLGRDGAVVRVWFTGDAAGPAAPVAGQLADDLQAAGWAPQVAAVAAP
jgi:hypothetical protein